MSDLYTEVLVKKTPELKEKLLKIVLIFFTVFFAVAGLLLQPLFLVLAVILGVVDYFFLPRLNVEYEYLYVNGELDIDCIFSKAKRKKKASYEMTKMEILAPLDSHQLDSYRQNRSLKKVDYSSGIRGEGHKPYAFVISENNEMQLVIFEPNEAILKDLHGKAPRKVFFD